MRIHAACAARPGPGGFDAVLLLGDSGSGKSDLLLRLLARGWQLVADDQVDIAAGLCAPPPALAGLIEVRGLGLFRLDHIASARLRLAVHLNPRLDRQPDRLPLPARHAQFDVPEIDIDPSQPSAPERIALAFDALTGKAENIVGAFAA